MAVKTLFNHITAITTDQDPKYWDKLETGDKKTWSNFMIHRFLSMNPDWVSFISEIQPYTEKLEPKQLYLLMIGIIPKGKYYLRYVKGKKDDIYEKWLVELLCTEYTCTKKESEEYLEILYATKEGREDIKRICQKYGVDPKEITKLKLKV
jgi:hypothetical protein